MLVPRHSPLRYVFVPFFFAICTSAPAGCAPPARDVPKLTPTAPANPDTAGPSTSADAGARESTRPALSKCLDAKLVRSAHACPPGPPGDLSALLRAENALLAARPTPTKKPAQGKKTPALHTPRELTATEVSYVEQAQRFVCSQPVGSSERAEALYGLARIYFEAKHWDEAAELFQTVAELPDASPATYAAQLSLECINVLGSHFGRSECFDLLSERTADYLQLFCGANMAAENHEMCATLRTIQLDLHRRSSGNDPVGGGK